MLNNLRGVRCLRIPQAKTQLNGDNDMFYSERIGKLDAKRSPAWAYWASEPSLTMRRKIAL